MATAASRDEKCCGTGCRLPPSEHLGQDCSRANSRADASVAALTEPPVLEGGGGGVHVGIVGGGPAGVTAALELARVGYRMTLFEARPRFGGRLWSARRGDRTDPISGTPQVCQFEGDGYADVGGMRIPSFHESDPALLQGPEPSDGHLGELERRCLPAHDDA